MQPTTFMLGIYGEYKFYIVLDLYYCNQHFLN